MASRLVVASLGVVCAFFAVCEAVQVPVIGIVGLPVSEGCVTVTSGNSIAKRQLAQLKQAMDSMRALKQLNGDFRGVSCFSSYYVKWLESAGARVVPIHHNLTLQEAKDVFQQINGVLYTGGELNLTLDMPYVKTTKMFYDLSMQNKDDHFPVWGTCQGFQLLNILTAWNTSVLCDNCFKGVSDIPLALDLTPNALQSRLFKSYSKDVVHILSTENVTQNFHVCGVFPETHAHNPLLSSFYDIMSTNKDATGLEFISTMEAKDWPIYGTQWHPERPQFEFNPQDDISHTGDAVLAMQATANFIVGEARKSGHSFPSVAALNDMIIENVVPHNLGDGNLVYVY